MYKPEINIDNKPLRVAVIGAGVGAGKSNILTYLALHAPDPAIVILESKPLNLGKLIPKPIEVTKLPVNYNRFRQGSNLTPKKKKRKK
jgi:hypothetical protein